MAKTDEPLLTVVIPIFNGAGTIGPLVKALSETEFPGPFEVVLVNDGSADNSIDVCRRLIDESLCPITLVDLARNFGEHNAVMAGLRHARGRWIITIDDDFQNPPSEVRRLLEFSINSDVDVVYTYYRERHHSWFRRLGSKLANYVADVLLDKPRGLYLSSFRCISRWAAQQVIDYKGPFPYVDGLLLQVTQRVRSIEAEHLPRLSGKSNYNLRRLIRLWLSLALNFSVMPLRISTLLGLLLSLFGVGFFILIVFDYFLHGSPVPGWASTVSIILLFSGAQLVMIGLVGEYLGRVYLTLNQRPQFIVRDVIRPKHDG